MTRYHQRFRSDVPVELWRKMTGSNMRQREADNSFTPHALAVAPLSNDTYVNYPFSWLVKTGANAGEITVPVSNLEFYKSGFGMTTADLVTFSADRPAKAIRLTVTVANFRVLGVCLSGPGTGIIVVFEDGDGNTNLARLDTVTYEPVWQRTVSNEWFYSEGRISMSHNGEYVVVISQVGEWPETSVQVYSYETAGGTLYQQRNFNWYDPDHSGDTYRLELTDTFRGLSVCNNWAHIQVEPVRRDSVPADVSRGGCMLIIDLSDLSNYKLIKYPALLRPTPIKSSRGHEAGLAFRYDVAGPYTDSPQILPAKIVTMWEDGTLSQAYEIIGGAGGAHLTVTSINISFGDSPLQIADMTFDSWLYPWGSTQLYSAAYPNDTVSIVGSGWVLIDKEFTTTFAPYPYTHSSTSRDYYLVKEERRDNNT